MRRAKILAVQLGKGGSGKTTTSLIFSQLLAILGYKVLHVDHDPQGNSSMYLGCTCTDTQDIMDGIAQPAQEDYNICELYRFRYNSKVDVKSIIRASKINNIDILPASRRLENMSTTLMMNSGNNTIFLKRALKCIEDDYDYIIIDNAPANNRLTVNSIIASDYIISPVEIDQYSLEGLRETLSTLSYLKDEYEISAVFLGGFLNKVDFRTTAYRDGVKMYQDSLGDKLFETSIRNDTAIKESIQKLVPILEHKKTAKCEGITDYCKLLLEIGILDEAGTAKLKKVIDEE